MNSLLSMLGNSGSGDVSSGGNGMAILMQAVGAAMRGESPQKFMKNLANSHPQLKKMNLDDLMGSAQQLAQQNNVSIDDITKNLDSVISPVVGR